MTDLVEALEQIAERGSPRGADAVLEAARRAAARPVRAHRHRAFVVVAVSVIASLGAVGGVVALRSDSENERIVTTPSPTTVVSTSSAPNEKLDDPTITCVFTHDEAHATIDIDPTLAPTTKSTRLDEGYVVAVSVLTDGGPHRTLRVEMFRAPVDATSSGVTVAPVPIGTFESGADLNGVVGLGGNAGIGPFQCDNARSRLLGSVGTQAVALATQQLAIGGTVQTPVGWVRTTEVPGGSSVFTTFTDPVDPANRYVVSTNGSLGSWYEFDGVPGSITPLVPADAKSSLVQFSPHAWRYERPSPDGSKITVGAWVAVNDPVSKKPNWYITGEITVPVDLRPVADAAVLALFFDYDRQ